MSPLKQRSLSAAARTLQTSEIGAAQPATLWMSADLTIPSWDAVVNSFVFVLFMVANMAEGGRNPFDVPGAPTEIVASYQTVYSSVYFVVTYLGAFIDREDRPSASGRDSERFTLFSAGPFSQPSFSGNRPGRCCRTSADS